jgi:glycosyltransferase involved in cell wall biosynthesis
MGEGETRPNLEGLSKKLDSEKNVIFPGFLNNPFKLMANSTAFVLSSRYEGFPNVLIEAMALGLPVISTDCPTGPREILGDGEYGLLVENEDSQALAKAMLKVALDMELRKRLSYQSSKRVKDFSHIEMVRKYEQSFIETIQEFEK